MNIRFHAHQLVTVAQTAIRSGEWIPHEDSLVKYAIQGLDQTLAAISTADTVQYHYDRLAEIVGAALTSGEWAPGDWACEWQGWCFADYADTNVVPIMPASERLRIAA